MTSAGEINARVVVVCTGASQRPHQPAGTTGFPPGVSVLDATQYHDRNDYRQDRC